MLSATVMGAKGPPPGDADQHGRWRSKLGHLMAYEPVLVGADVTPDGGSAWGL